MTKLIKEIRQHGKILWALMLREVATRYGRDNLGFLWVVGEPLVFTVGVMIMWSLIRPPYDRGIKLLPFVVTGYMPLLLIRHVIQHGVNTVRANNGLLYHRKIKLLHLYTARCLEEVIGTSLAFMLTCVILIYTGVMSAPSSLALIYIGWFSLAWIAFGLTLIVGSLGSVMDFMEKIIGILTYLMVPLVGTFYMVAWVPYQYRAAVLRIPFVNCVEMIRGGYLGDSFPTYYNIGYTLAWGLGTTFVGLIMVRLTRDHIEID